MDNIEYFDLATPPALPPKELVYTNRLSQQQHDWSPNNNSYTFDRRPPIPPKSKYSAEDCNRTNSGVRHEWEGLNRRRHISDDENRNGSATTAQLFHRPKLSLDLSGLNKNEREGSASCSPERKISGQEIANKVSKFEMLAVSSGTSSSMDLSRDSPPKNLWFYKDGLRTPTTPPPTSARMVLSVARPPPAPATHVSSVSLTLSPRSARRQEAGVGCMTQSLTSVVLAPDSPSTTSTLMTSSLNAVVGQDGTLIHTVTAGKPPPPPLRTTPLRPRSSSPPPLPPKAGGGGEVGPPRPLSKELQLEDILSMCAEYERQIETEQREAMSISFYSSTPYSKAKPCPMEESRRVTSGCGEETLQLLSSDASSSSLPISPSSTLTQPRIKTNGSLPREGKPRMASPARSLPPTSPLGSEADTHFSFATQESQNSSASSSSNPTTPQIVANSPPSVSLIAPSAASPRTRIKTIAGSRTAGSSRESSVETLRPCSTGSPAQTLRTTNAPPLPTYFSISDYQGGEESIADTEGKSKEELYMEARDILALIASPGDSPTTTALRRPPPRSKHDGGGRNEGVPSNDAASRLLIGTVMLGQNRLYGQSLMDSSHELVAEQVLRAERDQTILEVTRTARQLAEIDLQLEEANRSAVMESSLLEAELTAQQLSLDELREEVVRLRAQEALLAARLTDWRRQAGREMTAARQRLEAVEASLDRLENEEAAVEDGAEDTDRELERLERIKQSHERLEAERRHFEDLEFRHMEEESILEADRDEVLRELEAAERRVEEAEEEVREMERQAHEVSSCGQDESRGMRNRREEVGRQLRTQQVKLSQLEEKLSQLLRKSQREGSEEGVESDDSGTITLSDEETLGPKVEPPPPLLSRPWTREHLNSGGSGEESTDSTSDLPQDSSSTTPSPNVRRFRKRSPSPTPNKKLTKRASMQRNSDRYLDSVLDGLTSADESRPMSAADLLTSGGITDASSWIAAGSVTLRRNNAASRATRPLTRYLPVTGQENFDLRAHIESAGHQIELCKEIILNSCSCRGYLSKQGARIRVWTRRWFVFDRNKRTLVYYRDKAENKAKGGIYFHAISEVYVDHQTNRSPSSRLTFCMKTKDKNYLLMAPTPEAMRIWVDVLFTGAEGYREFQN